MEDDTAALSSTRFAEEADVDTIVRSNSTYFAALAAHLQHHADGELLAAHMPAIRLCAERLIQLRVQGTWGGDGWLPDKHAAACADALHTAVLLAQAAGSNVDAALGE